MGTGGPIATVPSELGLTRDGTASHREHRKPEAYGMLSRSIGKKFTLGLHEGLYYTRQFRRSFLPIELKVVGQAHVT